MSFDDVTCECKKKANWMPKFLPCLIMIYSSANCGERKKTKAKFEAKAAKSKSREGQPKVKLTLQIDRSSPFDLRANLPEKRVRGF
jgi:hypothetical protein